MLGFAVGGVDAGGVGAAGEQDAVDVQGVAQVLLRGQPSELFVAAFFGVGGPAAVGPGEVGADDDSGVVVLEALGGVDAADLLVAAGVAGPELAFGARTVPSGAVRSVLAFHAASHTRVPPELVFSASNPRSPQYPVLQGIAGIS